MLAKVSYDEVDTAVAVLTPSCPRRDAGGDRDLRKWVTGGSGGGGGRRDKAGQ